MTSVNKILIQTVYISDCSLIHMMATIQSKQVHMLGHFEPVFLSCSCSCGYSVPCGCCMVMADTSVLPGQGGFGASAEEQSHDRHHREFSLAKSGKKFCPTFGHQWCNLFPGLGDPCHTLRFQSPSKQRGEANPLAQLRELLMPKTTVIASVLRLVLCLC